MTGSRARRICSTSSGNCPTPTANSLSCRERRTRLWPQPSSALAHSARFPDDAGAPRSAVTPVSALLIRHLEGEAVAGQVFAGMVGRVSELRDQKVPRPLFLAAVDLRIKV